MLRRSLGKQIAQGNRHGRAPSRINSRRRNAAEIAATRSKSTDATPTAQIYVSRSLDPYFNLSFEDWLFRKTDARQTLLFLYRDRASVVIGRNQNPWKEIDTHRLAELGIPFVRRRSGGGTVYHDEGNTNFSVMLPRSRFDRRSNAELVARAVCSLGPRAYVNERHDVCVEGYKVSGSAFKLVNARAYHHGTMLIDSKLDHLRGVLHSRRHSMVTKGVASVPSPVANLSRWTPALTHDAFVSAVANEFASAYGGDGEVQSVDEDAAEENSFVRQGIEELKSWDWQYGQTPEFTFSIPLSFLWGSTAVEIHSKHGRILSATAGSLLADATGVLATESVCSSLAGSRYGLVDRAALLDRLRGELDAEGMVRAEEVVESLCEGM